MDKTFSAWLAKVVSEQAVHDINDTNTFQLAYSEL